MSLLRNCLFFDGGCLRVAFDSCDMNSSHKFYSCLHAQLILSWNLGKDFRIATFKQRASRNIRPEQDNLYPAEIATFLSCRGFLYILGSLGLPKGTPQRANGLLKGQRDSLEGLPKGTPEKGLPKI